MLKVIDKTINKTKYNFKFIDLGGGMGISYNDNKIINYKKYNIDIKRFLKKHKSKIIFEPGRSIIGNTGTLLSKIIYIKKSEKKDFVILDAGMNDLMRPALYDSKHFIIPSKKNKIIKKKRIEFVGPICESADKFLNIKKYQKISENDFLLILDVGAYGMSLASNYCFRPKPAEILINKSSVKLIRKKEDINRLI